MARLSVPSSTSTTSPNAGKNFFKVLAACSIMVGAIYVAMGNFQKFQPSPAINNGNTGEGFMGGRGGEDMQRQMARDLGLSREQQAKLQAARDSGDWRAMRETMETVLTPEQRDQARQLRQARMAERQAKTAAMLSPQDMAALQKMREQRGWGGRGQGRGPGGQGTGRGEGRPNRERN